MRKPRSEEIISKCVNPKTAMKASECYILRYKYNTYILVQFEFFLI